MKSASGGAYLTILSALVEFVFAGYIVVVHVIVVILLNSIVVRIMMIRRSDYRILSMYTMALSLPSRDVPHLRSLGPRSYVWEVFKFGRRQVHHRCRCFP